MATFGHPFLSAELDELRSRQRRVFALLDDALVAEVESHVQGPPRYAEDERPRREWAMRKVIEQKLADEPLKAHLEEMARIAAHNLGWEVFEPWDYLGLVAEEPLPLLEADAEIHFRLTQLAALHMRADGLAGDYKDPRLRGNA
ncbi:MAG: hypothetical protein ACRD12_09445 [Acidimicrobiales bacterium]